MVCNKPILTYSGKVATILAGLFSATSMIFWRGGEDETRSASDESKKKYFSDRGDIFTCHLAFTEWLDKKKTDPSMKSLYQNVQLLFFFNLSSI